MAKDKPAEANRVPLIQVRHILDEFGSQVETQPPGWGGPRARTRIRRIRSSSSTAGATCSSVTKTCGGFMLSRFPVRSSVIRLLAWPCSR